MSEDLKQLILEYQTVIQIAPEEQESELLDCVTQKLITKAGCELRVFGIEDYLKNLQDLMNLNAPENIMDAFLSHAALAVIHKYSKNKTPLTNKLIEKLRGVIQKRETVAAIYDVLPTILKDIDDAETDQRQVYSDFKKILDFEQIRHKKSVDALAIECKNIERKYNDDIFDRQMILNEHINNLSKRINAKIKEYKIRLLINPADKETEAKLADAKEMQNFIDAMQVKVKIDPMSITSLIHVVTLSDKYQSVVATNDLQGIYRDTVSFINIVLKPDLDNKKNKLGDAKTKYKKEVNSAESLKEIDRQIKGGRPDKDLKKDKFQIQKAQLEKILADLELRKAKYESRALRREEYNSSALRRYLFWSEEEKKSKSVTEKLKSTCQMIAQVNKLVNEYKKSGDVLACSNDFGDAAKEGTLKDLRAELLKLAPLKLSVQTDSTSNLHVAVCVIDSIKNIPRMRKFKRIQDWMVDLDSADCHVEIAAITALKAQFSSQGSILRSSEKRSISNKLFDTLLGDNINVKIAAIYALPTFIDTPESAKIACDKLIALCPTIFHGEVVNREKSYCEAAVIDAFVKMAAQYPEVRLYICESLLSALACSNVKIYVIAALEKLITPDINAEICKKLVSALKCSGDKYFSLLEKMAIPESKLEICVELIGVLEKQNDDVRRIERTEAAIALLEKFAVPENRSIICTNLLVLLNNRYSCVAQAAINALEKLAISEDKSFIAENILLVMLRAEDESLTHIAINAMEKMSIDDPATKQYICEKLMAALEIDQKPTVKRNIIVLLGKHSTLESISTSCYEKLVDALDDQDLKIKCAALSVIKKLTDLENNSRIREKLMTALENNQEASVKCAEIEAFAELTMLADDETKKIVCIKLMSMLDHQDGTVREVTIFRLTKLVIPEIKVSICEKLQSIALKDLELRCRESAIIALELLVTPENHLSVCGTVVNSLLDKDFHAGQIAIARLEKLATPQMIPFICEKLSTLKSAPVPGPLTGIEKSIGSPCASHQSWQDPGSLSRIFKCRESIGKASKEEVRTLIAKCKNYPSSHKLGVLLEKIDFQKISFNAVNNVLAHIAEHDYSGNYAFKASFFSANTVKTIFQTCRDLLGLSRAILEQPRDDFHGCESRGM